MAGNPHQRLALPRLVLACLALTVCAGAAADDAYIRSINTHRASIDQTFRDPRLSPLLATDIGEFRGLRYFPIDPAQRLEAEFRAATDHGSFLLPATNNRFLAFSKLGSLTFLGPGDHAVSLTLYQRADLGGSGRLTALAPFRDLTNDDTTYAGGRYLKYFLPLPENPLVDFNRAVNPYCAYDATIACPIPPVENRLAYRVSAGEMTFEHAVRQ